jgi:S-adenosyl-L-methionine hydrolase (adenosine-forming)
VGCGGRGAALITLTTDFGYRDAFVGIMKGVIAQRAPGTPVVDLSHGIPPQDTLAGALVLRSAAPYFPHGAVHVAVVDPGVGSSRAAVCLVTERALWLGPDNGVLSLAVPAEDMRAAFAVTNEALFLSPRSRTFHGRDVFAPVAAALATGTPPQALGASLGDVIRLDLPAPTPIAAGVAGQVIYIDHFGNLVTNLPATAANITRLTTSNGQTARLVGTYAEGAPGELIAVVNGWDLIEIAARDGSAAERLGARVGDRVQTEN